MARPPLDPDQIPDDASGRDLAGYVGEDVGRQLALRVAAFVALLCALGGATTDADDTVRAGGLVAGALGALALLVAGLGRWRRARQWLLVAVVLLVCGGLLAVMLGQHRAAA
ncbi:hypothetical protein [Nocardioides sp. Leaf374]|uniref:hypothetical protein n=1 Tax=Nocardioides sp. Leaf374 TaxID=2876560 RepID=UPI001E60793A|nr:hypothetical protein [Nocardioides sp. Leaf374]